MRLQGASSAAPAESVKTLVWYEDIIKLAAPLMREEVTCYDSGQATFQQFSMPMQKMQQESSLSEPLSTYLRCYTSSVDTSAWRDAEISAD